MVSKYRQEMILKILNERHSVTIVELTDLLGVSESTARRDIAMLDRIGRLVKVYGGAVAVDHLTRGPEPTVEQKNALFLDEKRQIARSAAGLIKSHDFVYLDAGTTTGYMIDFLEVQDVIFVTNAVAHAQRLAQKGMQVLLLGGFLKGITEAVVGENAVRMLQQYHFTKGFFGANGVSKDAGFTTPDPREALIKQTAAEQCETCYFLCDHSKLHRISAVKFAPIMAGPILTDEEDMELSELAEVKVCKK